ncbi:MAG: DNA polymerase III subunit chi [Pseudomonadota bacterium]|nr:DNA polymerase III subunit chi [Pseudomonadota bacterium]
MAEAWFYHLTDGSPEATAPDLTEKCLSRGWRVAARCGTGAMVSTLDRALWTFRDDSFLPHGTAGDGDPATQPVYLTAGPEVPNGAAVLMLVDGAAAAPDEMRGFERVIVIFDGADPRRLDQARGLWRETVAAGLKAVYWAQDAGRWVKKAESGG